MDLRLLRCPKVHPLSVGLLLKQYRWCKNIPICRAFYSKDETHLKCLCLSYRSISASKLRDQLLNTFRQPDGARPIQRRLNGMGPKSQRSLRTAFNAEDAICQTKIGWKLCIFKSGWWEGVIFSREYKINLIGAGGWQLGIEVVFMVHVLKTLSNWGVIIYQGVLTIWMMEGSTNAEKIKTLITEGIISIIQELSKERSYIGSQDYSTPSGSLLQCVNFWASIEHLESTRLLQKFWNLWLKSIN